MTVIPYAPKTPGWYWMRRTDGEAPDAQAAWMPVKVRKVNHYFDEHWAAYIQVPGDAFDNVIGCDEGCYEFLLLTPPEREK